MATIKVRNSVQVYIKHSGIITSHLIIQSSFFLSVLVLKIPRIHYIETVHLRN